VRGVRPHPVQMVNYYEILKVSPEATSAEIKSAYRRLARKLHPDTVSGSEETAVKFAEIAEAYEILGNAKERTRYDRQLAEAQFHASNGSSPFMSDNRHVKRWRQMVFEKRYNDIIDRMLAEERLEALAFQRAVFPFVALLISCLVSTAVKPKIFISQGNIGKIIIVSFFVVGLIHLAGRIQDSFTRYTESEDAIHDSILDGTERAAKPMPRVLAAVIVIGSVVLALATGYAIGSWTNVFARILPSMFSENFEPEFFLYPPIITFFVDVMHSLAYRFERSPGI